jgi:hypothetical protein
MVLFRGTASPRLYLFPVTSSSWLIMPLLISSFRLFFCFLCFLVSPEIIRISE